MGAREESVRLDADLVVARLHDEVPPGRRDWSGGWPGEIEVALIDAVLSIRATYGRETTGVRAAVARYRQWWAEQGRDDALLDDLERLAGLDPQTLVSVLRNRQRTVRGLKAEAIVEAAKKLGRVGVNRARDVDIKNPVQHEAYTSVLGLGEISWEYLGLVLGQPSSALVDASIRAVVDTLQRPVSVEHAERVILDVAATLRQTPAAVHRALWTLDRSRPRLPEPVENVW